ncbi:sensor histidine kinase [Actinomadura barringtoniae]|uniref:histidine kinase n=1 Tax=Actinomadura barringtoniae TaxID=1427535 RepID=A0A939PI95_9ACTN|nr:histidine kinase [Actinomadura barringtoniae]MBO2453402.1 sensor histidine kinase [Actinomadura barringtoniae]
MRLPHPLRPLRRAARPAAAAAVACLIWAVTPIVLFRYGMPWLTTVHKERLRAIMRVEIPDAPMEPRSRGLRTRAARWQAVYHLVAGPPIVLGQILSAGLGVVSLAALLFYAWMPLVWDMGNPVSGPVFDGANPKLLIDAVGLPATIGGVTGLYVTAWLFRGLGRLDVRAATVLLGPSREQLLTRRLESVTESRAGVVDAADAERRRIERDLHDGAQQRLVSLAVGLGVAKATLADLSDDARLVIDKAHGEAKAAIDELNELVRGLHPAVLEDRGLDAALSGVVARAPIPVRLNVDLATRPAAAVEAVAYFVVSEALANVVKHAQASRADVTVERHGGTLLIVVADDGLGGADPGAGTGLAGLAKRVASVDGKFALSSPSGGPTVLTAELPCAR